MSQNFNGRTAAQAQICRIAKFAKNITAATDITDIDAYLEQLVITWDKYNDHHEAVLAVTGPAALDEQLAVIEPVEQVYLSTLALMRRAKKNATPPQVINQTNNPENSSIDRRRQLELKPIECVTFSGGYVQWQSFADMFTTLVHSRNNYTDIEKFHYLRSYTSGEAAALIAHMPLTNDNYNVAWTMLTDRYTNRKVVLNALLDQLFNQPPAKETACSIKSLLDTTSQTISMLDNARRPVAQWDDIIVYFIIRKLPADSRRLWETQASTTNNTATWAELKVFLVNRFRALESISSEVSKIQKPSVKVHSTTTSSTGANHKASGRRLSNNGKSQPKSKCNLCGGTSHYVHRCIEFLNTDPEHRRRLIEQHGLCLNCFGQRHSALECPSKYNCFKCNERHHTLLHPIQASTSTSHTSSSSPSNQSIVATAVNSRDQFAVILPTAQVSITDNNGITHQLCALIDQGSQITCITEYAVQLLRLTRQNRNTIITAVGQCTSMHTRGSTTVHLTSIHDSNIGVTVDAYVLPKITSMLPTQDIDTTTITGTSHLQFADPDWHKPKSIDLLIGAYTYCKIIERGLIHLSSSMIAQKTIFGWILSGQRECHQSSTAVVNTLMSNDSIADTLKQFWDIAQDEGVSQQSVEDTVVDQHYAATHRRLPDGRYQVRLPFFSLLPDYHQPAELGNSLHNALAQLHRVNRRMQHQYNFRKLYCEFMDQYLQLNHMELIPANEILCNHPCFYLPHHAVMKESSSTTKLRVVFDASRKTDTGMSLNDISLIGPKLQPDLTNTIIQWRQNKVAFCADVEKMYRQIMVHPDDRDMQRIVWYSGDSSQIAHYRLRTITYGTSSAPYLAIKTMRQLAIDERDRFPLASEIVLKDMYVDDVMSGSNCISGALEIQRQLLQLFASAGMQLKKWASNNDELLAALPTSHREVRYPLELYGDTIKTLGITWDPTGDELGFSVKPLGDLSSPVTKRQLLSEAARLFDPLGWLTPTTLIPKLLFQKLWLLKSDWDTPLPDDILQDWTRYRQQLPDIAKIRIPRWTQLDDTVQSVEYHGFSDASLAAYAAVVYSRVTTVTGHVHVALIIAKSKAAPIDKPNASTKITLPRLELCGVALLANLMHRLKKLAPTMNITTFAWCDSTIALSYLRAPPNTWKVFVANRTSDIHTKMPNCQFRYINTKENPADAATRGILPSKLLQHDLWWCGPAWLSGPSSEWPNRQPHIHKDALKEARRQGSIVTNIIGCDVWPPFITCSTFTKMVKVTAWCLRFINNTQRKCVNKSSYITAQEYQSAISFCVLQVQHAEYRDEIDRIAGEEQVIKNCHLTNLVPFIDERGVMRVGGRLRKASIPYDEKHPIILPKDHPFSKLVIDHSHRITLHGGISLTLTQVRRKYWIVRGRAAVKKFIHSCVVCVRYAAVRHNQLMADLPVQRITPAKPFLHVAVDYAGPVETKHRDGPGRKVIVKGYIAVFVCMVSKAIHLEAVTALTSEKFIDAFRRFVARRGHCTDIYSDCGTNFVGANRMMQQYIDITKRAIPHIGIPEIDWHFSPPGAPHFNGLAESGVKSTKIHLRKVLGNFILTYEDLSTLLAQIEACLNSRPLVKMNDDPACDNYLTPGHFLIGCAPMQSFDSMPIDSTTTRSQWASLQQKLKQFWRHWSDDYLVELQRRVKWTRVTPNPKIGDIVLIRHENLPPLRWPLAQIEQLHPGSDGLVRAVSLRTANGTLKRPIVKLCWLPVQ